MSGVSDRKVFTVTDAHGKEQTLAIGLDKGRIVWQQSCKWATADPETVKKIGTAFLAKAAELDQQRLRP